MKADSKRQVKSRKSYTPSPFQITNVKLEFNIKDDHVIVRNVSSLIQNKDYPNSKSARSLILDGTAELLSLKIDEKVHNIKPSSDSVKISVNSEIAELEVITKIYPSRNTSLNGLYASNGNLFTQCEPEGFRNITYFLDRPDNMSTYTVSIEGDKDKYPHMLSNGNCIESKDLGNNRHLKVWQDPFPKPCYLFALVAANLEKVSDTFETQSGKEVKLELFVESDDLGKTEHAMNSLKRAMLWDEKKYGLEYDLDVFMIVAVSDFNMGAMENKGLNIFNAACILANHKTSTDRDFIRIESVVAHEYFHNWTGNRVTCRDWFQLTLKEGLTVFREQEFTADMHDPNYKRIEDVQILRKYQFPEDAGPSAHPVRPESYIEINNFYTHTVYEKGAEIIRMYQAIFGKKGFKKGMETYLERHDGQAVTCDDFLQAMTDANNIKLNSFENWYSQAGTPRLKIRMNYNQQRKTATFQLQQNTKAANKPFLIPLKIALLDNQGKEMPLQLEHDSRGFGETNRTLRISHKSQSFTFVNVHSKPIPSLLRSFSAPIILEYQYSASDLAFLAQKDTDPFNRFESAQKLIMLTFNQLFDNHRYCLDKSRKDELILGFLIESLKIILDDEKLSPAIKSAIFTIPSSSELIPQLSPYSDPLVIDRILFDLRGIIAENMESKFLETYENNITSPYKFEDWQKRQLKNLSLSYLMHNSDKYIDLASNQFFSADNMTDQFEALLAVNNSYNPKAEKMSDTFAKQWSQDSLVMDKWFGLQAITRKDGTLEKVRQLKNHPCYMPQNPNKIRQLIGSFKNNIPHFYATDNSGLEFIAEQIIEIDKFNQIAASNLAHSFDMWRYLDVKRQNSIASILNKILQAEGISPATFEVISKALKQEELPAFVCENVDAYINSTFANEFVEFIQS